MPRLVVLLALLAASVFVCVATTAPTALLAQDPDDPGAGDPMDPDGPDGDDPLDEDDPRTLALENPHLSRSPVSELQVTLIEAVRDEYEFSGFIEMVNETRSPAAAIKRIPFEGDVNFETRAYELQGLREALGYPQIGEAGTWPASTKLRMRVEGGSRSVDFTVGNIDSVTYPATWLEILDDMMAYAAEQNARVQLATLVELRSAVPDEDLSERMREAFHARLLDWFRRMHEAEPDTLEVYLGFGDFLRSRAEFDQELQLYLKALSRDVDDVDGLLTLRLARIYLDVLRLPERALDICNQLRVLRDETGILVHSPEAMETLLLKAHALLQTSRYAEAQVHLNDVLDLITKARDNSAIAIVIAANRPLDELESECRWLRGRAWLLDGQLYLAGRELARVQPNFPQYRTAQLDRATVYFYEQNRKAVTDILSTRRDPDSTAPNPTLPPLPELKAALDKVSREKDPVEVFAGLSEEGRRAYDPWDPDAEPVPFNPDAARAMVLLANSQLDEQMRNAIKAMNTKRQNEARQGGVLEPIYAREIQPRTARQVGQLALRALRHDPTADAPYLVLAEHFMRQGNQGQGDYQMREYALMWLDRSEQVNPNNPMLWYRRGFYAARNRDFLRAIPALKRAIELQPDFVDAYVMLGELHYRFVESMRNNPEEYKDLTPNEVERQREELLRLAMAYFKNALSANPDRLDVMLKLGHCYLERAQNAIRLADSLQDEISVERGNQSLRTKLETVWSSIVGDLTKAEDLFDITRFAQPRVLDVIRRTADGVPEVVVAVGTDAAVVSGLTFRVLKPGHEVRLAVSSDPGSYTCVCKPVDWDRDRRVQEQISYLQPGDRVGDPDMPAGNNNAGEGPFVIYPEQTIIARSALGYVYYLRDYVAGARKKLAGEDYAPTSDLQRSRDELRWVLEYVKGHGSNEFTAHPAYLYAWKQYFELHRQHRRQQWVDEFERGETREGGSFEIVGLGWRASRERDGGVYFKTGSDGTLTMHTGASEKPTDGRLTMITRGVDHARFSAVQGDLVVNPESMMPARLQGSAGLVVRMMEGPEGELNEEEHATRATLVVRLDDNGTFTWQTSLGSDDKNNPNPLGAPNAVAFGPEKYPAARRRVRTLRVERRFIFRDEGGRARRFGWYVVVDDRLEAPINLPNDHPLCEARPGNDISLQVGVFIQADRAASKSLVQWDAVHVITEKSEDWIKEIQDLRKDLGGR